MPETGMNVQTHLEKQERTEGAKLCILCLPVCLRLHRRPRYQKADGPGAWTVTLIRWTL
jgi:hypothetical protein